MQELHSGYIESIRSERSSIRIDHTGIRCGSHPSGENEDVDDVGEYTYFGRMEEKRVYKKDDRGRWQLNRGHFP
jgi:hypothetical protein